MENQIETVQDLIDLVAKKRDRGQLNNWSEYPTVTVKIKGDLILFNYNSLAQYSNKWSSFEIMSRGLIIDFKQESIVSYPFDKFFNWGQNGRYPSRRAYMEYVFEKLDGSMVQVYWYDGKWRTATRGSFDSEQALWAQSYVEENFNLEGVPKNYTLVFEAVYPDNWIVVDYGKRRDMVLLAVRDLDTLEMLPFLPNDDGYHTDNVYSVSHQIACNLPVMYPVVSIENIIETCGKPDFVEEGFVVQYSDGSLWKFKGDNYLHWHRLKHNVTFRYVLESMRKSDFDSWVANVPDEFLTKIKDYKQQIEDQVTSVELEYSNAIANCPYDIDKRNRGDIARWINSYYPNVSRYVFMAIDGKLIDNDLRKTILHKHDLREQNETQNSADES